MEPSLQRRIQQYGWDKAAGIYENSWQAQLRPAQEKLLELAALHEKEKVIDLACGTGLVTIPAAKLVGKDGIVLGTDISERMVEMATRVASDQGITQARFERMDAEALSVPDNTYDAALCALGLMYVPNPVKALQEMYRVLKPGGRAIAAVWGQRKNCGWAEIFEIVDRRVRSEVCPMFFHTGNPGVLIMQFEAAGFTDIREERIHTLLAYSSGEEACEAAFAGGPVALAFHRFPADVKVEVFREYLDSIAAYKVGNEYKIPGEFVIVSGYRRQKPLDKSRN